MQTAEIREGDVIAALVRLVTDERPGPPRGQMVEHLGYVVTDDRGFVIALRGGRRFRVDVRELQPPLSESGV